MTSSSSSVALVTGGAQRIGRKIALALAQRGWDVVVHYHQSATQAQQTVADIRQLGQRAVALQCDLQDEAALTQLLPRAALALGPVSCLVNNASLFEYDALLDFSLEQLNAHMHVNLAAPILLVRALHQATPAGNQAVAINLLDQKLFNLNPDFLSYTLSKAALQAATVILAQACAPTVRVMGIAPGLTLPSGDQTDAEFAETHTQTPLGQSSTAADVADAVCFVVENASMTGSTLVVDGGQHLVPSTRDVMFTNR